ncbi:MAG: UDP-N-acetylmuramoyl-tripeptide--D-alanyl-D-alanine ligase [Venatoribacter sp.]
MFKPLTLAQVAMITQGQLVGDKSIQIGEVSKDTRTLKPGDLYLAIKGENFDGHAFIGKAQELNAAAAVVEQFAENCTLAQIKVANSIDALGNLAGFNRDQFQGPIVAVTGSAGKTSVKQLVHSILSQAFNALKTEGNLNNHIGAPFTLLRLNQDFTAAVIELGASGLGEIAYTAKWVKPDVAIITNAGEAHVEGFGSLQGIVQTKGELLDYLPATGSAILNADDPFCETWAKRAQGKNILYFGLASHADVHAENIKTNLNSSEFLLCFKQEKQLIHLPLLGTHNIRNALAAAASALALGLSLAQIKAGLEQVTNVSGRLEWVVGGKQQRILNDAYNANPASVRAAIDVLKQAQHSWLVLGDMAELGRNELQLHKEVGAYAKAQGIQHLLACGTLSKATVEGFGEQALWFENQTLLAEFLQKNTTAQDVILIKGSRSSAMDCVVHHLQQNAGA